ncbi:MAG: HAD family hydrolase [Candidatus Thorarchaeota archaeon]
MSDFSLKHFDAIIFDLDSTLINTHNYPLKATTWVLERHSENTDAVNEEYLTSLVSAYRHGIKQVVKGAPYRPPFKIVESAIAEALTTIGVKSTPELALEATNYFKELHIRLAELYPSVDKLLSALKSLNKKIGVITNGFEGHSEIILKKLGVRDYFQAIVDTGDVETYKPRPEPFEYALSQLGTIPERTLYIGDEYLADIVGSKALGLSAVWVNLRNHDLQLMLDKFGSEYLPDLVVDSISRLIDFL